MNHRPNILALTRDDFCDAVGRDSGGGRGGRDAIAAYRDVFRTGRTSAFDLGIDIAPIAQLQRDGETIKFTQPVGGGLESESVVLPQTSRAGNRREALCVSSQIGCAMGCTFCETAQMGLMKNLSAAQIVAQWFAARFELGRAISNIVFMGMGEPLDNVDAVIQAIRVLSDDNGAAIAPSQITVSTVGRIAGMQRLLEFASSPGYRKLRLAVSLNAPNDEIRSDIMPINRAEPIDQLVDMMKQWTDALHQRVLIEYVLIPGVNDELPHADELAGRLHGLPCTVNVIPYNPRRDSPWPAPEETAVDAFVARLMERGQFVKRRRTMGRPVMAACGQLGNEHIRRRRFQPAAVPLTASGDTTASQCA